MEIFVAPADSCDSTDLTYIDKRVAEAEVVKFVDREAQSFGKINPQFHSNIC